MPVANPVAWYRLGDGHLALQSDDAALRGRVTELYADCAGAAPDPDDGHPRVRCVVRVTPEVAFVTFDDPEPLDPVAFALTVFPDRGYAEHASSAPGWRLFGAKPQFAFSGPYLLADRRTPWQGFVGNLAVNRLLRLQRDIVFFHAAAAAVGERGVLLMGEKGTGKTTLSLALAALGHLFLGDELIGLRPATQELVPVRRSATIKAGPAAAAVRDALARATSGTEQFPDGSVRRRVRASLLFPDAVGAPLRHRLAAIVFLGHFIPAPRLEPIAPRREEVRRLTPLACSLWDSGAHQRAFELASLLSRVPCYLVNPGPPEETAALIARTVEG